MAGGERKGVEEEEEEEKRRQKVLRRRGERDGRGEEQGRDGKMKDEGWFSHKLPKAPLLTVFLSEDERTLLR